MQLASGQPSSMLGLLGPPPGPDEPRDCAPETRLVTQDEVTPRLRDESVSRRRVDVVFVLFSERQRGQTHVLLGDRVFSEENSQRTLHENTFNGVVTVGLQLFSKDSATQLLGDDDGYIARSTHVATRCSSRPRKAGSQMIAMSRFTPLPFPTIRRLPDGLLPAGKEQHDRRTNLNNTTATTAVGGDA